jgi:hypothetical protein
MHVFLNRDDTRLAEWLGLGTFASNVASGKITEFLKNGCQR